MIRVLVVEDEPLVAQAHADYVGRVPGFEVVGVAHSAREAARLLAERRPVDLVLLDMHLPDGHGLELVQRMRAAGELCDVMAVTAARDADVVRRAVAHGVVLYLVKPFTFAAFRAKAEQYAEYRRSLLGASGGVVQEEVDRALGVLRPRPAASDLPKGLAPDRLADVVRCLREADGPLSASEVGARLDASRVTARRYLEHLADAGSADRSLRYGSGGRPEVAYRWAVSPSPR